MDKKARASLIAASAGLLYPSESDFPFEFVDHGPSEEDLREVAVQLADSARPVKEQSVQHFFEQLRESPDALKYSELRRLLQVHLTELKVFRVGEVEVDVFLLGRTRDGQVAGLRTKSIET